VLPDTTNGLCHAKKCAVDATNGLYHAKEASGLTMLLLAAMHHMRAPIIPKTLVGMGTLLNTSERLIPIAVTTRSTNHESANLGWRRVSPNAAMLGRGIRLRGAPIDNSPKMIATIHDSLRLAKIGTSTDLVDLIVVGGL
jgi:hypothetical protein